MASKLYERRTIVPGLTEELSPEEVLETVPAREQWMNFRLGIADLTNGEPDDHGLVPDAPMLNLASGGFFVLMPLGGETMGLVVDRAAGRWRANKTPGQADRTNGRRSHSLSDLCATPFQYTAPDGAPPSWDGLVLGGPAGVAIDVATDGVVTITAQADIPANASTITMTPSGDITISVGAGNSVNAGGVLQLTLAQALQDFLAGAFTAAPVGSADGGATLKTWLAAKMAGLPPAAPPSLVAAAGTQVTKGE